MEHRTKKRHEQSNVSTPMCLAIETLVPQRMKNLSETDEQDQGFLQIALQKRKFVALAALAQNVPRPSNKLHNFENLSFPDTLRQGILKPIPRLVRKNGLSHSLETRRTQLHPQQIVSSLTPLPSLIFLTVHSTHPNHVHLHPLFTLRSLEDQFN